MRGSETPRKLPPQAEGAHSEVLPADIKQLRHEFLGFYFFRLLMGIVRQDEFAVGRCEQLEAVLKALKAALARGRLI